MYFFGDGWVTSSIGSMIGEGPKQLFAITYSVLISSSMSRVRFLVWSDFFSTSSKALFSDSYDCSDEIDKSASGKSKNLTSGLSLWLSGRISSRPKLH